MIAEKLLLGMRSSDSHDPGNVPVVEFTAHDVKQILDDDAERARLRRRRKSVPVLTTPVRLECFSDEEWAEYKLLADAIAPKRGPSTQETACADCTLAFQTSNILYGRCWPQNLRATPLGRLYHGELEDE